MLIYTGDTLSALEPLNANDEKGAVHKAGGLSALTAELFSYEQSITAMTRQRIVNKGEDASGIVADAERGLLGEHPYLLLDYGGWERATDPAGLPYVQLQLRMFRDLHYAAVGCTMYERLAPELWREYARLELPPLVRSAGQERAEAPPHVPVVIRDVHGAKWGVAAVPLPPGTGAEEDPFALIKQYVEQAALALEQAGAEHSILLCRGGPQSLYTALSEDIRFDVVIGVSQRSLADQEGMGKIRATGPVMLPELQTGGREFGTCHLIYPTSGAAPVQFNFQLHPVEDDLTSPFPYRRQVQGALAEREKLLAAKR